MKLPPQAKKVFTGQVFDVYHWEQEMYDGSFETFEMLKRPYRAAVIAIKDGKIVLSRESQPTQKETYSLLGGRVDEGEEMLPGAKRELLEEAGMQSDSWELYKTFQPFYKIDWDIFIFIAKNCKKVSDQKLDSGEKIEIIECTFDEFVEIVLGPKFSDNELVMDILRMKSEGTLEEFKKKLFS